MFRYRLQAAVLRTLPVLASPALTLVAVAVLAAAPDVTDVQVADFEDVPTLQTGFVLPTKDGFAYKGLTWTGFFVINSDHGLTKQFPRAGYRTGRVSGRFVGVGGLRNAPHSEIWPETEARFDVISLYLTAAWRDGLMVRLDGLRDGATAMTRDLELTAGRRQRLELGFDDIDALRISSTGGEDAGLCAGPSCSPGPEVVLDDLVFYIRTDAPQDPPPIEPSAEVSEAPEPAQPTAAGAVETAEAAPAPEQPTPVQTGAGAAEAH